jgi:hypothetical protein
MNMTKLISKFFLFALALVVLPAAQAEAKPLKMIFFYPGGQGSQEQAQSLLDGFSEALKKTSGGEIQAEILYISDAAEGRSYIQNQKPAAGILSLDVYLNQATAWGAEIVAQTLQLPSGDGQNQYFLLGRAAEALPQGPLHVYTPLPLEKSFFQEKLFPKLNHPVELEVTANVLGKLRKIGLGSENGWVLLDQFEYTTISRLNSPWAKNLTAQAASEKVPSAPFVIFRNNIPPQKIKPLQEALIKLAEEPSAQEILPMLRLKGFKAP